MCIKGLASSLAQCEHNKCWLYNLIKIFNNQSKICDPTKRLRTLTLQKEKWLPQRHRAKIQAKV